jgi:LysM repeat protein
MKYRTQRTTLSSLLAIVLVVASAALPLPVSAQNPCGATYTVVYGDTLNRIALRCHTTLAALLAANPDIRNPNVIYVGQRLAMPGRQEPGGSTTYVVQRGDWLARIAERFNTSVPALLQANPHIINPNFIHPGQRLIIPSGGQTGPQVTVTPNSGPPGTANIYLIALEDNGQSGKQIGCNDSVVPVEVEIEPANAPLRAALEELFSIDSRFYGQSGLYNALYDSDLHVENIELVNGQATIQVSGTMRLGGVCDVPRFKAQIQETALQFPTVNEVMVFINGESLDQIS